MKPLTILTLCAALLMISLTGCVSTQQADNAAAEIRETHGWYCGPGLLGIRAVARFVITVFTGQPIPDVCRAIDVIVVEAE